MNTSILPVVIKGAQVPALLGESIVNFSAFRCRGEGVELVLFQIDEVNARGRYSPNVPGGTLPRDEPPAILDENDEIVFMLRDLGERCAADRIARASGRLVEVEVGASYLKEPAYVYLLSGASRAHAPAESYVRYEAETHRVIGNDQVFGFQKEHPMIVDEWRMRDFKPAPDADVLDRLKVRLLARALGNMVSIPLDESKIESTLVGVRVGPVRVVRELDTTMAPVPGYHMSGSITYYNYNRLMVVIGRYDMPGLAAAFVSSMDMSITMDFIDLRGLQISTKGLSGGTLVDGKMIGQEKAIPFGDEPWYMATGQGLNVLGVVAVDRSLDLTANAVFIDSDSEPRAPENVTGGLPELGYEFVGWENLKAQEYSISATVATLTGFPEGGGGGFYRVFQERPQIRAKMTKETKAVVSP